MKRCKQALALSFQYWQKFPHISFCLTQWLWVLLPDWPHLVLLSASEPIWWSWNFLSPAKLFSINLSFPGRVFVANRGSLFSIFLPVVFCHRFSVWLSIRSWLPPSSCFLECRLISTNVLFQYYKTPSFLTKTKIKYWDIEKYWKMCWSIFR